MKKGGFVLLALAVFCATTEVIADWVHPRLLASHQQQAPPTHYVDHDLILPNGEKSEIINYKYLPPKNFHTLSSYVDKIAINEGIRYMMSCYHTDNLSFFKGMYLIVVPPRSISKSYVLSREEITVYSPIVGSARKGCKVFDQSPTPRDDFIDAISISGGITTLTDLLINYDNKNEIRNLLENIFSENAMLWYIRSSEYVNSEYIYPDSAYIYFIEAENRMPGKRVIIRKPRVITTPINFALAINRIQEKLEIERSRNLKIDSAFTSRDNQSLRAPTIASIKGLCNILKFYKSEYPQSPSTPRNARKPAKLKDINVPALPRRLKPDVVKRLTQVMPLAMKILEYYGEQSEAQLNDLDNLKARLKEIENFLESYRDAIGTRDIGENINFLTCLYGNRILNSREWLSCDMIEFLGFKTEGLRIQLEIIVGLENSLNA